MKKLIMIILGIVALMPMTVLAETQVRDFRETVESIGLTFKATDYEETNDQVTIYLFRMTGCEHCHDEISWLNDIAEEYGSKFKLRSFEITSNQDNSALYKQTVDYLGLQEGVPLAIIADQYFRGFSESTKDKILAAIDEVYESKSTYDLFEEMENNIKTEDSEEKTKPNMSTMIIFTFLGIFVLVIVILFIVKK